MPVLADDVKNIRFPQRREYITDLYSTKQGQIMAQANVRSAWDACIGDERLF